MTADPPAPGAAPPAPARWWRAVSPPGRLAIVAAVLVVVCAGGGVILDALAFPAAGPIRQLFGALATADYATAARLAGCQRLPQCTEAVLHGGYRPPTDLRVEQVSGDGPASVAAAVSVSYRLPGRADRATATITVIRPGGARRAWTIRGGALGYLRVTSPVARRALVAGLPVGTTQPADASTAQEVTVLPGTYTVGGTPDDPMFDPAVRQIPVAASGAGAPPTEAALDLQLRASLTAVVQGQVDTALDACATRVHDILHAGCPFDARGDTVSFYPGDDVTWTVSRYPQIGLRLSDDPDADGGPVVVDTVTPGEAVGRWPGGSETDDVTPRGVVNPGPDGAPLYGG